MRKVPVFMAVLAVTLLSSFSGKNIKVSSSAFKANGMMPAKYSCEDKEVSPPLSFSGVPSNTKTLAIIMHDPDAPMAGGFTHWVVWNIDPVTSLPEDFKGADQGKNGAGKGYKGMCPPSGTHHYHIKVYALDARLDIDKSTDKAGLEAAMRNHILAEGELIGLYKKMKP